MYDFTQNKASKKSLSHRKLVYGAGINDAGYMVNRRVSGRVVTCPIYSKWRGMLRRCYSVKDQEKYSTYIDCTVSNEFLTFSNFRVWMLGHDHEGMELDKDIKVKGNKIYSPETCLFIPSPLNSLLTDSASKRGLYPVGVSLHKPTGRFQPRLSIDGKNKYLGYFSTPEKASRAYQSARTAKIQQLIKDNVYPNATPYLAQHIFNHYEWSTAEAAKLRPKQK